VPLGLAEAGLDDPIVDPILAVMEAITLLSAPLIVVLMVTINDCSSRERKVFGVIALSFAVIMAGLTSAVHFVALTAGRQTGFAILPWPSPLYALELLVWDVFLGLSLIFAAFVFGGAGIQTGARWSLLCSGTLCLVGVIGPILGDMVFKRLGIIGYGVGLQISCLFLARYFYRHDGGINEQTIKCYSPNL